MEVFPIRVVPGRLAIPNSLAGSDAFAGVAPQAAAKVIEPGFEFKATSGGIRLFQLTGGQLTVDSLLVYAHLLLLASEHGHNVVQVDLDRLAVELGRTPKPPVDVDTRASLYQELVRLTQAHLRAAGIRAGAGVLAQGSLVAYMEAIVAPHNINNFRHAAHARYHTVEISQGWYNLFQAQGGFAFVQLAVIAALKSPLARWLYSAALAHKTPTPIPVERIYEAALQHKTQTPGAARVSRARVKAALSQATVELTQVLHQIVLEPKKLTPSTREGAGRMLTCSLQKGQVILPALAAADQWIKAGERAASNSPRVRPKSPEGLRARAQQMLDTANTLQNLADSLSGS